MKRGLGIQCSHVIIVCLQQSSWKVFQQNSDNFNLIWLIDAKRHKQKGHFKCIKKKHEITPRSCYLSGSIVLSSFFMLTTNNVFHCVIATTCFMFRDLDHHQATKLIWREKTKQIKRFDNFRAQYIEGFKLRGLKWREK